MNWSFTDTIFQHFNAKNKHAAIHIDNQNYSYAQLLKLIIPVQAYCAKHKDVLFGVIDNQDIWSYIAILGILKSGKGYVPINPQLPYKRIEYLIHETKIETIFSSNENNKITQNVIHPKELQTNEIDITEESFIDFNKTAYVIYTSGSSGYPKGVPISYNNLNSLLHHFIHSSQYSFSHKERMLQVYDLSFDVSVFSTLLPLCLGGTCIVLNKQNIIQIELCKALIKYRITILSMVPTFLSLLKPYFDELYFPDLKYCFFSGDKLYQNLAEKWQKCIPNAQIVNCYGPTETTIVCTEYFWNAKDAIYNNNIVSIGKSFAGMHEIIKDKENIIGELCYNGNQVFDGYINHKQNNFFKHDNISCYPTGDMVSVHDSGNLIFHFRKDRQIKIQGYRIELAEIEYQTQRIMPENQCIAISLNEKLYLFIENTSSKLDLIKEKLKQVLPIYMIPDTIIGVKKLPLNINQKIDINKLIDKYIKN